MCSYFPQFLLLNRAVKITWRLERGVAESLDDVDWAPSLSSLWTPLLDEPRTG